jgi:tRNA G18 (ribose-2'-O)-methylase SpoU
VIIAATEAALKVEMVEDPADPRIASYRDARDGLLRRREGLFLAEGRLLVRRLLAASRFSVESLLVTPPALDDLRDLLAGNDAPAVHVASAETIRAIVGFKFHRGCLALGVRGEPLAPEALMDEAGPRTLLALEDVADPDNVGAVFRNAAALGAAGVLLSSHCADPLYRKAIRVSMGATLSLPFARASDWPAALATLRQQGYRLVALCPREEAEDIVEVAARSPRHRRLALLLGTEGAGLSGTTRAVADVEVRIPMAAGIDSLNVAAACGIALHRFA